MVRRGLINKAGGETTGPHMEGKREPEKFFKPDGPEEKRKSEGQQSLKKKSA